LQLPISSTIIFNQNRTPMRIRNTMLYTILCCALAYQGTAANHYKIQLGVFVKKIPFTHFAFSGVNDVYMDTDENNVYHYYLRTTFEEFPIANRVKNSLVVRGFSTATVIPLDELENEKQLLKNKSALNEEKFSKVIYYNFDQYELDASAKKKLNRLLKEIKKHPSIKIAIIGHTDSKGEASYNVELSKNRVRAVKKYLLKKGVLKNQFITKACGEASPTCSNICEEGTDLPENRKLNRRVMVFTFNTKGEIIQEDPIEQTVHPILEREDLKD